MKLRKSWKVILAWVLLIAMAVSLYPTQVDAASSSEIRKQLNALKDEKKALQEQIDAIRGQYKENENELLEMVNQKNIIDQEIALLLTQVDNINDQIASYSLLIANKQAELDEAEDALAYLSQKNKERIRAIEEEGKLSYWEVLFKANSFADLLDRLNMVKEIAASDKRRMEELSAAADAVTKAQEELAAEKAELELTQEELAQAQVLLEEKRVAADELVLELIATGEEFQLLLEQSEDEQDKLMKDIAAKEKELKQAEYREWMATYVPPTTRPSGGTKPSAQAPSSSGWVCPVPYYRLTSPFGMRKHPILGYNRMHNGVDMACAAGTPIYAAKSGKVTIAGWGGQAGNYVSINHGDGFASVYMHMTNYIVRAGQYVTTGQVIGYVGSTGLSSGPHLHFGISYNGTYVNPMAYI
jgi:murein DD-endopeptidase MepM/ murein hydrolase activator NlpD